MVVYDPYTAQQSSEHPQQPQMTPQKQSPSTFEREKAAITSYEDGWDDIDGPIWPVGAEQCELQSTDPAIDSYEQGWDDEDGPVWPVGTEQCELQDTAPAFESYEEGWDDSDGPMWPVGTEQCELQSTKPMPHEDDQSLPPTPTKPDH